MTTPVSKSEIKLPKGRYHEAQSSISHRKHGVRAIVCPTQLVEARFDDVLNVEPLVL